MRLPSLTKRRGAREARRGAACAPQIFVLLLGVMILASGCGAQAKEQTQQDETLTVFAASSLSDAFGEISTEFERENPGVRVRLNFAGSSTLAAQIGQGAPADVFASADEAQMRSVSERDLASSEPESFARNSEVVVIPKENPANIRDFKDLSKPGTKLVLAQEGVPAAEYAEEILANAAEDSEYGEGFERDALGNVVSRESDVRAAVNRVVTGDADATFGYRSDVTPDIRDEVRVIEIPRRVNVTASYPIAALDLAGGDPELAREWVDFVRSEKGQNILGEWGFDPATG